MLLPVGSGASRAPRAQQRNRFDGVAEAPEIDVGGPAFQLVAGEQVEEDVAMVQAAERAVGVELDAQSPEGLSRRRGEGGAWSVFIGWFRGLAEGGRHLIAKERRSFESFSPGS